MSYVDNSVGRHGADFVRVRINGKGFLCRLCDPFAAEKDRAAIKGD